jgi:hypothetical protein
VSCQDLTCNLHASEIEEYTMSVLEAVESTSKDCLPSIGGGGKTRKDTVAGWSEFVIPYADESKFWTRSSVWSSEGSPRGGQTFVNMKHSKRQYKYAVRRLKRCNDTIQNEKFLAGVVDGGCDIFNEIRKFRGKSNTSSSRIDDEVGSKNIASHFAGIYSELFNRVLLFYQAVLGKLLKSKNQFDLGHCPNLSKLPPSLQNLRNLFH